MGFLDNLASAVSPNRIHYVLPSNVDAASAPSHITIDGFATLKAETTRFAGNNKFQMMVDETIRQPMRARVVDAAHPAVAAATAKPKQASLWAVFTGAVLLTCACFIAPVAPIWAAICGTVGLLMTIVGFAGPEEERPNRDQAPAAA